MTTTERDRAAIRARPMAHDDLIATIDARVAEIERELAAHDTLREERNRLLHARRALVVRERPARGSRLSAGAALAMLAEHPASTAGELAALLGAGDGAVRAHLHRLRQTGGCAVRDRRWYITDERTMVAGAERHERSATSERVDPGASPLALAAPGPADQSGR